MAGKQITSELIDTLADAEPLQVICPGEAFQARDYLRTNIVQIFKARMESQESEIIFKTM